MRREELSRGYVKSNVVWALVLFAGLPATTLRLRAQTPGNAPIRIVLPARVEPASCHLTYQLVGPFGGYGGIPRSNVNPPVFEIETVHEGQAVNSAKAVLYCPGYQVQTMTFDPLPDSAGRTIQSDLKPLGTARFLGLVRGLTSTNTQALYADVSYMPGWICEFFQLADCGLGSWRIASVKLDTDGKFAVTLPDFVRDDAISTFKYPGNFTFRVRDQETGNRLWELRPAESGPPTSVSAASAYPALQIFDAEVPK